MCLPMCDTGPGEHRVDITALLTAKLSEVSPLLPSCSRGPVRGPEPCAPTHHTAAGSSVFCTAHTALPDCSASPAAGTVSPTEAQCKQQIFDKIICSLPFLWFNSVYLAHFFFHFVENSKPPGYICLRMHFVWAIF